MSDGEEENPLGTATRMQRLREELTREQQARATLTEQVRLLESQLQRQRTQTTPFEDVPQDTKEDGTEDARSSEEDQPLLEEENALPPVVVQPLNEEGLQSLTKLYKSMGESQRLQGISLARPSNFSGLEVVEDLYALTHWYREVSCWVQGYAKDPIQQVVLALQTLKGTARIMVDNIIMSDPKRVSDLISLFKILKETFQRRDPGPDAWKEFQRARLRTNRENVIGFLNRLLLLSFVINMSEDPTCPTVSESDIATKLRMGLPYNISNQLEQHMQLMVDVGSVPDISPWGIAATALKVEAQEREKSWMTNRQPRLAENKANRTLITVAVHALPERSPTEDRPKWSTSGRAAKRFQDLPESLQKRIVELQKELQDLPLGGTLTPDQQQRCASNSLCIRCRRYGHDARNCQQTKPMIPKN
eukprot:scaffold398_cov356-Pavlova_lutheri.AAC.13